MIHKICSYAENIEKRSAKKIMNDYNTFTPPSLPLKKLDWTQIVPLLGKAHSAVGRFDALLGNVPNPGLLILSLISNEAVLSSRIEGTLASLEDVFRFQAEGNAESHKKTDIQEVINYREAMDYVYMNLDDPHGLPLSARLIKGAHLRLMEGVRGESKNPGKFRTIGVHIGASGRPPTYIPPEPSKVPDLMQNLEQYIHSEEQDTLVQSAILHAQFEMINPFTDGNGRVGRLIIPLFLYEKKVIALPYLYISEYLEGHRQEYYDRLGNISEQNDWEGWIIFFLNAITEQSKSTTRKLQAIINLKEETQKRIQQKTRSRFTQQMTDFIFANPIFTGTEFAINIAAISTPRLLKVMTDAGIIEKMSEGKGRRSTLYIFRRLLDIVQS